MRENPAKDREDIREARIEDGKEKERMKEYRDKGKEIKEHNIGVGDQVLLKRKSTKHDSVYDPQPYKVVEKYGTQVVAERR